MRKLKLFSLALMALFSMSMWATDFTLYGNSSAPSLPMSADGIKITGASTSSKNGSSQCSEIDGIPSTKIYMVSLSSGGMLTVDAGTSNYIVSVSFVAGRNSSGSTVSQFGHGGFSNDSTTWSEIGAISAKGYDKGSVINVTPTGKYRYYSFGRAKLGSTSPSTNAEARIYTISVTIAAKCSDPNASIIDDAVGFVGDAIDLEFTSENTSERDTVVKLDDATATKGTDYTFVAEGFKPLTAGEFEITISQAKDGTHCEVEESVTLTISQKTPVTDFTIPASSSARKGDDVNLSITNLDAAATKIGWILAGDTVSKTADYVFTPNAAGSYVFTAYAANEFNTSGAIEKSCTITVTIGTDATLSALAVTGKTLTPAFDADEFSYSVGEIGVYEKLTITYTVNDAPYATAVLKNNIITDGADTVVVTAEDGETVNNYIINYTRAAATELVSISGSTTWDWTNAGSATGEQTATTLPTNAEEFNFADVLISPANTFNAAALSGIAQFANRGTYFQGYQVKFNTTVPGKVSVDYSNTGSKRPYRHVEVNGTLSAEGEASGTKITSEDFTVEAGDVVIKFYIPDATKPQSREQDVVGYSMGRIYKIVFTKSEATALDNAEAGVKAVKRLENGMLVIEKNGVRYNAQGQIIR